MPLTLHPGRREFLSGCDIPWGVLREIYSFITKDMKGFWWVSRSIAMNMCPPIWQKHQWVNNSSPSFVARELCGSRRSPGLSLSLGFLLFAGGCGDSRQLSDSLSKTGWKTFAFLIRLMKFCFFFWGFIRLYFIFCYILLCWSIIYLTECIYVLVLLAFDLIFLFYLHLFSHLFYALFKSLLWSFDFASWTFLFLLFNLACIFTFILFHFRLCFDFMTFEFDAVFWWWF